MFAPTPYRFVRLLISLCTVGGIVLLVATGHLNSSIAGIPAIAVALPASAIALALVSGFFIRVTGENAGAPVHPRSSLRVNPLVTFYLSIPVFLFAAGGYGLAELDATLFTHDAACASGFALALGVSQGACRLERATIVGTGYHFSRSSHWYEIDVARADGSRTAIHLAGRPAYGLYRAARAGAVQTATLQIFHGRVAALQTTAGTVRTADDPAERRRQFAILGLIAGVAGIASAVGLLARSF